MVVWICTCLHDMKFPNKSVSNYNVEHDINDLNNFKMKKRVLFSDISTFCSLSCDFATYMFR